MRDGIIKGDGTSRFMKAALPDTYESFKAACASGAQPLDILMNLAGWDTIPDFLNKETLLQDETEVALFGNAANRTVDAVFRGIAFKFKAISDGLATVKVTITDEGGKPVSGVLLTNVQSDTGGTVLSDASGIVNGYIAEGNAKIAVSGYGDLVDAAIPTFTAVAGGSYTKTLTVKRRTYLNITASKTFRFSGDVATVDVALVDGGDSGGWGNYRTDASGNEVNNNVDLIGGRGGNAGKAGKQTGIKPEPGKTYQAVVGSGGTDGNAGGKSSFMGVTGTTPNGIGGSAARKSPWTSQDGTAGTNGTETIFTGMSSDTPSGGGGGAGQVIHERSGQGNSPAKKGGTPGGGDGRGLSSGKINGTDGLGGGGGGSDLRAQIYPENNRLYLAVYEPGRGGKGRVTARIHLK